MPVRPIARLGEPLLRSRSHEVDPDHIASRRIQTLIDDMIETLHDARGAGLAAPQVFEPVRICVMEVEANERYPALDRIPLTVLINPRLQPIFSGSTPSRTESVIMYEGCLSVPGLRGRVQRARKVNISALDRTGNSVELHWEGPVASVVQHEVDHLDGVLFVDRVETRTLCFLDEYAKYVPMDQRILDGARMT